MTMLLTAMGQECEKRLSPNTKQHVWKFPFLLQQHNILIKLCLFLAFRPGQPTNQQTTTIDLFRAGPTAMRLISYNLRHASMPRCKRSSFR